MLIALLAVLGVNLAVIAAVLALVLLRRAWVMRQPGAFRAAIRVAEGDIDGLRPKWARGYGRWVRDVLVWTKAPFLFRNEILATDGLAHRRARSHDLRRLGAHPVVVQVRIGSAVAELAAHDEDVALASGPYGVPGEASRIHT